MILFYLDLIGVICVCLPTSKPLLFIFITITVSLFILPLSDIATTYAYLG